MSGPFDLCDGLLLLGRRRSSTQRTLPRGSSRLAARVPNVQDQVRLWPIPVGVGRGELGEINTAGDGGTGERRGPFAPGYDRAWGLVRRYRWEGRGLKCKVPDLDTAIVEREMALWGTLYCLQGCIRIDENGQVQRGVKLQVKRQGHQRLSGSIRWTMNTTYLNLFLHGELPSRQTD